MGETNPNNRKIRLYFGPDGSSRPTKEEVGEFIVDEMGLVQGPENKPQWSQGVCELIELGMQAWEGQLDSPETHKRIEELESQITDYRLKIRQLEQKLEAKRQKDGVVDPADRVHRIEARILEVLCRDEHQGTRSMNFVDLYEVTEQTGLQYSAVVKYAEKLEQFDNGVELDMYGEKAKATSPNAFEAYCEGTGIDPEVIR